MRATFDFVSLFQSTPTTVDPISKSFQSLFPYPQFFDQLCKLHEDLITIKANFPASIHIRKSFIQQENIQLEKLKQNLCQINDNAQFFEDDHSLLSENTLLARLNQKNFVNALAAISKSQSVLNKLNYEIREYVISQRENQDLEKKLEEGLEICEYNLKIIQDEATVLGVDYE
eukprot:EST48641.1 Hypothetical protein SS50377_11254 [Spironucleus salmonicida]